MLKVSTELRKYQFLDKLVIITAKVVVFDGLRAESIGNWLTVITELCRKGVAVILCSSESVRIHVGNTQDIIQLRHRFPSWSLEEYESACENGEVWSEVRFRLPGSPPQNATRLQKKAALTEKFPVAGHSARFMFRNSNGTIVELVEEGVKALGSSINSLQAALSNDGNAGAVNRLIAFLENNGPNLVQQSPLPTDVAAAPNRDSLRARDGEFRHSTARNIFVSARAARAVLQSMPKSVDQLRTVAATTDNRAIEGYALEICLQDKLKQARDTRTPLAVTKSSGQSESWTVTAFQEKTTENIEDAVVNSTAGNCWFWVGGNQGEYDAIHIYDANCIRFVQVTAGASHSFYLDFVDNLLQNVAFQGRVFSTVDFVTLRPSDDLRAFSLESSRGRLGQGWNDFTGQPWTTGDARNHARELKLDW